MEGISTSCNPLHVVEQRHRMLGVSVLIVFAVLLAGIAIGASRFWAAREGGLRVEEPSTPPLVRWLELLQRLPDPLLAIKRRRWSRLRALPFPQAWRDLLARSVPLYATLSPEHRRELEGHTQVILAEKRFEGCDGLVLTDEMRVTIAAHAALLLLGTHDPRYYPNVAAILVYPTTYVVPMEEDHGGIVEETHEPRLGESWRRGVVVLAWDAARADMRRPQEGDNVILHEFAHQLDTEDGVADGVPQLDRLGDYREWVRALSPEYERLRADPDANVLDEYGATDPAEFFAVATETFFTRPHELREQSAAMYAALRRYDGLDPAALVPPPDALDDGEAERDGARGL
jgi:Mlc titration factor MtfA (ptsG expression regulator)